MIKNENGVDFFVSDFLSDPYDMKNRTLDDYADTFNSFVGIANKTIDWFNNPYLEPKIYEMDESWVAI